jgi:hypothetical protein
MKKIILFIFLMVGLLALPGQIFAAGTTQLAPKGDIISSSLTFTNTTQAGSFGGAQAIDNLVTANNAPADNGLLFSGSDTFLGNPQLFAITGFTSSIGEIWLYTLISDTARVPASVTIKSSTTSQISLNATDYETTLVTLAPLGLAAFTNPPVVVNPIGDPARADVFYAAISVNAPAGTQSLFFDFNNDGTVGGNGTRLQELQAFAAVPEPSSMILLAFGAIGLSFLRKQTA